MNSSDSNIFTIERAYDTSSLKDFYCGIPSMDDFIHASQNGLNDFVVHSLTNLWIVKEQDAVIGFFALSKSALVLNSMDVREMSIPNEKDIFELRESFPAIKIDYLAIREDLKLKGLGSEFLSMIRERAINDEFSATMFVIVDALDTPTYSAVFFYRKNFFIDSEYGIIKNLNKQYEGERVDTRLMYLPLF